MRGMAPATLVAVMLGTGLFVAVHAYVGAVAEPVAFYAPDAVPVALAASPIVGNTLLGPDVVERLVTSPLARHAVPQTLVATFVAGAPVIVRGAELESLLTLHDARVEEGALPAPDAREALAGARAAHLLNVRVGDRVLVPAGFAKDVLPFRIVGIVDSPNALGDELLVPRTAGAQLAGAAPGAAHLVEVVPWDRGAFEAWLEESRAATDELRIIGPSVAAAGSEAVLRVVDSAGRGVGHATLVSSDGARAATDALGVARVHVREGASEWRVEGADGEPMRLAGARGIAATSLRWMPEFPRPGEPFVVEVEARNFGAEPAAAVIEVRVDGARAGNASFALPPGSTGNARLTIEVETAGQLPIEAGETARARITVAEPEALRAQWRLASTPGVALQAATPRETADAFFGSVALASALLVSLAFALFFAGNAALFARLVRERAPELRLLRALGASRGRLRAFALRELAPFALAGAAGGMIVGFALAEAASRSGVLRLLGHTLRPSWTWTGFGEMALLALLCTLGAVVADVERFVRRQGTERAFAPPSKERLA